MGCARVHLRTLICDDHVLIVSCSSHVHTHTHSLTLSLSLSLSLSLTLSLSLPPPPPPPPTHRSEKSIRLETKFLTNTSKTLVAGDVLTESIGLSRRMQVEVSALVLDIYTTAIEA
jgi:hypothetical protein